MNTSSQDAASGLSPGRSAINNGILYVTLSLASVLIFLLTLVIYAWQTGGKPWPRLGYAIFVSVLPALGAMLLFKLTRLFVSWQRVATVYLVFFILTLIVQSVGRLISIN